MEKWKGRMGEWEKDGKMEGANYFLFEMIFLFLHDKTLKPASDSVR